MTDHLNAESTCCEVQPVASQALPAPLVTDFDLHGNASEMNSAEHGQAKKPNAADMNLKPRSGAKTSLPFIEATSASISSWMYSSSTSDILSHNKNFKLKPAHHNSNFHHHHHHHHHNYGQLEHPSRNGTLSMPNMVSKISDSIVSPTSVNGNTTMSCPYPTRSYALDVLQTSVAPSVHHPSITLDQFGLPIWPISAMVEQEAEILALIQYLEPTVFEQEQQLLLFNAISEITNNLFRNSRLVRFGSTVNGFSLRGADVDFCLFVGNVEETVIQGDKAHKPCDTSTSDSPNAHDAASDGPTLSSNLAEIVLTHLGAALMSHGRFTQIKVLTRARVPIIKLKDSVTGISCDIGVNNTLALHNTRLLFLYAQYDPRVLSLARIIKWWARKRAMNDSYWGTLSSYCLLMMLIFYLQQGDNPILPILTSDSLIEKYREWRDKTNVQPIPCESSIHELLAQCSISSEPSFKDFISSFYDADKNGSGIVDTIVDGKYPVKYISDVVSLKKMLSSARPSSSSSSYSPPKVSSHGRNLCLLLSGFFRFYTQTFSFSTEVVSPRTGKSLTKESKKWSIQVCLHSNQPLRTIHPATRTGFVSRIRLIPPRTSPGS